MIFIVLVDQITENIRKFRSVCHEDDGNTAQGGLPLHSCPSRASSVFVPHLLSHLYICDSHVQSGN